MDSDVLLPQGGETRIRVLQAACDDYRDENAQLRQDAATVSAAYERMWSALQAESTAHVQERGELRDEVVRLNQQIVDRDTTIMLEGEKVERLLADLDRANEHNRNLMAEVNQLSKVLEAARNWLSAGMSEEDSAIRRLESALAELDKAEPKLTKEEFEQRYAQQSGVTVEWLRQNGRRVEPCDCGECRGWQMGYIADASKAQQS